jgi:4-oxalmesaconate hydratase
VIVDAHAHLVAPAAFYGYRANLLASGGYHKGSPGISDEALKASADSNVALMDEVGTDVQFLSPRPFQQMQSAKPERIVHWWIEATNDLIARTVAMHPSRFAGIAGLPLCSGQPVESCFDELDRAVNGLGFVGVTLNPDAYEGTGYTPPMGDPYWYPLYERVTSLGVPILMHSSGCASGRESYSAHFITEESIAALSLLESDVFDEFPELAVIIPHGGGSVPYQIGRWQAERFLPSLGGDPGNERFEIALRRLWFDTVLHHPPSLELLIKTVGADRVLFGTERPGSGSATDPETGLQMDDFKRVIDGFDFLKEEERTAIYEGNARQIFSRFT